MISSVSVPGSYLVGSHDLAIGGGDGEPRRVLVCVVTVTSAVSYPADQPHSLARAVNVADPSWIGSERSLSQVTVLQTIGAHKPTGHLTSIIAASRAHQWVIDPMHIPCLRQRGLFVPNYRHCWGAGCRTR
jgi:hypothetical protein